jgi:hypothetical protein
MWLSKHQGHKMVKSSVADLDPVGSGHFEYEPDPDASDRIRFPLLK